MLMFQKAGLEIFCSSQTVDIHIPRLREALNINEVQKLVRTVHGAIHYLDIRPNSI